MQRAANHGKGGKVKHKERASRREERSKGRAVLWIRIRSGPKFLAGSGSGSGSGKYYFKSVQLWIRNEWLADTFTIYQQNAQFKNLIFQHKFP
jgi:hypothetical protein